MLVKSGDAVPVPIGAEDLYRFRWIDHVRLSRDGERVAYQLSGADPDSRQNRSRVVVRRLLDPEPVDAVAGPRHHVASPLGAWLLLALCAPASQGETRESLNGVLGCDSADAAELAAGLLAAPHPVVPADAQESFHVFSGM